MKNYYYYYYYYYILSSNQQQQKSSLSESQCQDSSTTCMMDEAPLLSKSACFPPQRVQREFQSVGSAVDVDAD